MLPLLALGALRAGSRPVWRSQPATLPTTTVVSPALHFTAQITHCFFLSGL
jgi:hypothetical protein